MKRTILFKALLVSLIAAAFSLFAASNLGISAKDIQFDTNTRLLPVHILRNYCSR